jgi:hypothetical protein
MDRGAAAIRYGVANLFGSETGFHSPEAGCGGLGTLPPSPLRGRVTSAYREGTLRLLGIDGLYADWWNGSRHRAHFAVPSRALCGVVPDQIAG